MRMPVALIGKHKRRRARTAAGACLAGLILAAAASFITAQAPGGVAAATGDQKPAPVPAEIPAPAKPARGPRSSAQRRAAKLYLESSKLFLNRQFQQAMEGFEQAARLDPENADYSLAAQVARGHEVTALIQEAAKDRLLGNEAAARAALARALALDPSNFEAAQHLDELADEVARAQPESPNAQAARKIANAEPLLSGPAPHSFHLRTDQRQLIVQVFKAFGITALLDDSVRPNPVRLDVDDVTFEDAARILGMVTHTFFVPVDAHHALVADDTRENRVRLIPQKTETIYLAGLSGDEMNEVQSLAKNVFQAQEAQLSTSEHTMTVRAPQTTIDALNRTLKSLIDGHSEVLLDVRMIQIVHMGERNTGLQLPSSITAFNVFAEEESLLSQNATLVQQIIASGLAPANDPLAILGILIASGQISSPLLSSGFALFGGGLTESALVPGNLKFNLNVNTSDSRELDDIQLRMEDGQDETIKEGERYPIQTATYSNLPTGLPSIPGLTGAGSSGSLSSLLGSLTAATPAIPMVEYQDLGLTLKINAKVLRNKDVALSIDFKLDGLSGQSIDGDPVLDNRAYSGVVTLREGEATVVATEMDKSQSLAISGTPGISEIPGLNNVTDKDLQKNYATLVIVMTPHVIRGTQAAGHTRVMRVENTQ